MICYFYIALCLLWCANADYNGIFALDETNELAYLDGDFPYWINPDYYSNESAVARSEAQIWAHLKSAVNASSCTDCFKYCCANPPPNYVDPYCKACEQYYYYDCPRPPCPPRPPAPTPTPTRPPGPPTPPPGCQCNCNCPESNFTCICPEVVCPNLPDTTGLTGPVLCEACSTTVVDPCDEGYLGGSNNYAVLITNDGTNTLITNPTSNAYKISYIGWTLRLNSSDSSITNYNPLTVQISVQDTASGAIYYSGAKSITQKNTPFISNTCKKLSNKELNPSDTLTIEVYTNGYQYHTEGCVTIEFCFKPKS